ncbi:MAG: C10 family peptidase, partial [Bacteroidales bacterium]
MKKSILLIFLLCVVSFSFSTNVVSVENAKKVSKNFLIERVGPTKASSMEIVLQQTEYDVEGGAIYYRFQVGQKGFIMISATDVVTPVLAYSLESNYETIPGVDYICNQYKEGIKTAKKNAVVNKQVVDSWKYYTADQFIPVASKSRSITSVEPLVTTLWNQGKYFNTYCPYDIGAGTYSDNRVPVGCVALTMVNIMYYYRYPVQPRGGISYIPLNYDETTGELVNQYPRQTVRFSDYTYNYDAMFNVVNTYDGELEKILYHAGVSNRMGYGPDGSGSISEEALEALKLYFKYSPDGTFEIKDNATTGDPLISDSMWIDGFMKYELDAHRPLFYSGRGNAGGHAWIVDGYCNVEEQTYFHVNWGWGGSGNGFFLFGRFFDGSNDNFSNRESLMKNLYPDDSNAVKKPEISFVRNTASIGSISDGAGHVKYAKNSDRKWMIAAPNATSYEFNFYKIKTEKDHDYITIYNGPTEASGVKLKISG